jgi:predicted GIY-YIG superfamily endonuclease
MTFWVYMLQCADDSFYTGHTDDLEKRLAQHNASSIPGCYTVNRLPVALVFSQPFETREEALRSERQIKGWSRAKKRALIRGDWNEISRLSRAKQRPSTGSGRTA